MESNEIQILLALLRKLEQDPGLVGRLSEEERVELFRLTGKISRPNRDEIRSRNRTIRKDRKDAVRQEERQARSLTGIRTARIKSVFHAPEKLLLTSGNWRDSAPRLHSPQNCYVCKKEYKLLHFFYDSMCPECADLNYEKRFQTADLRGQVVLITGSRLKIGYQSTLMLLRAGATVHATTRFPVDSALRFSREKDYLDWSHRLHIYGLDLRHTPSVELFARYLLQKLDRLDHIIHNAAQTVRRPVGFYSHLMEFENTAFSDLPPSAQTLLRSYEATKQEIADFSARDSSPNPPISQLSAPSNNTGKTGEQGQGQGQAPAPNSEPLPIPWHSKSKSGIGIHSSAQLSQIPYSLEDTIGGEELFPTGKLDADLQQIDLRKTNSWRLTLGEISTAELLEVQLVNIIAPFVLTNHLLPLVQKDPTGQKHIVNVSAMEGKFHRFKKESRHPHTNIAKAALNMLTHTAAGELVEHGIHMNSVDTGWVTDEDPVELSERKQKLHDFQPPLDIVDGAARVLDPIFDGIRTGKHWNGKFLKDYFPIEW